MKNLDSDVPYFVYREPYDLIWGAGWMAMSEEMGNALKTQIGEEVVGRWIDSLKPIITGFDPAREKVPEDLLEL